jgi:multidrug efflux pump
VNDFNRFGRTWQVNVQADAPFRMTPEYVRNLRVRNAKGEFVPLGAVATITDATGPVFVQRYNMYPAAAVNGNLTPGTSSGDGIRIVDAAAAEVLPKQLVTEWTELFYLQTLEGNGAVWAFALAVVLVFLVLAAKYESWSLPLAIILVVPMCLLSAVVGVRLAGADINIFVQVGFVVLVGLAAKNAILIVEFAQQLRDGGKPLRDAVVEASELRLRPIVMTSFAFILGVVPLVLAEGAGAEMRATLGVAVFSGMIGVTVFGVLLTPVFAYVIGKRTPDRPVPPPTPSPNGQPAEKVVGPVSGG